MQLLNRAFNRSPLKAKIIWIIALSCLLVLGCSIAGFAIYDRVSHKNNMVSEQQVLAKIIAERSAAAVAFSDQLNAQSNLESLRVHKLVRSACIYQQDTLFSSYYAQPGELQCPDITPDIAEHQFNKSHLKTLVPITLNDVAIGKLYIIATLTALEQRTTGFFTIAALLFLIAGGFGFIVASRLIGIAIRPLGHLEATASAIKKRRDYSVRSEKEFDDDIGMVIDTFNSMLDTIEEQNNALKDSEEALKTIINDAPDLMQIVDQQGNITFVNHKSHDQTGGGNLFDNLPNEQLAQARAALRRVFAEGCTTEYETQDLTTGLWFANHLGPLREKGQIISALVMKRDITALKLAHDKLSHIAFYDPLTSLPNRRLFRDRLAEALDHCVESDQQIALMFLDLDNFKPINDNLGHEAGDRLLITIAERLAASIRAEDIVSRLGGDEFTVMLNGVRTPDDAEHVARKIIAAIGQPISIENTSVNVSTSIGIAIAPLHGDNVKELMQAADIAMYRAKAKGKNTFETYNKIMTMECHTSKKVEQELSAAIDNHQFQIYYQPQVILKTMEVVGVEALLRWNHPQLGQLPPDEFIDKFETHGLMKKLTQWTLHNACREINQQITGFDNIRLAINLSAQQFRDPELVNFIRTILAETHFPANRLELEITETSLVTDFDQSIATMKALRQLGISLSIDDFGTGYSSLSYLRKLPINFLKIDRSFITELPENQDDREITTAVISMAHNLNLAVLAEGVESEAQLRFLKNHRCDYVQGFFISPPVPVDELARLANQIQPMLRETTREILRLV